VSKGEASESLDHFVNDVGIPNELDYDGAGEQTGRRSKFEQLIWHYKISKHVIQPFSPWQNKSQSGIRIIKARWKWLMIKRKVPKGLWDFALVWIAQIYLRSANKDGRTSVEIITGDTPDISNWVDFTFYDWVWYWHSPNSDDNPRIGQWLGVSHHVGNVGSALVLCYWILSSTGRVLARTTVQHITTEDIALDEFRKSFKSSTTNYQMLWETITV
jgi:hypothetical protein